MTELEEYRQEIDQIDREMTALFLRRMEYTAKVGAYKQARGLAVLDAQRERQVLEHKANLVDSPEEKAQVTALFEGIMAISRRQQRGIVAEGNGGAFAPIATALAKAREPLAQPRVIYQGVPGAYTEEAAVRFFGEEINRTWVDTWDGLFDALTRGEADYGVVPIENNSTGSINQVYDLLAKHGHFIVGEQVVKVEHCLMAPKGATLESLQEVYSHPQGILQCAEYLKHHPSWQKIERKNTAEAAEFVAKQGKLSLAAIGSRRAAALYGLEVLAEDISLSQTNYTRFVVVSPVMERRAGSEKISALFSLPHRVGALHEIMTLLAVYGLNLTKLESRPMVGKSWEYRFFLDFTGVLDGEKLDGVLREITQIATEFRLLGQYAPCEVSP